MTAELAASVVERELGGRPERGLRRVGSRADRRGVDRPGPPGHHPRRPGRRRQGPVPGRRRGHPGRPGQLRAAAAVCPVAFPGLEAGPLVDELRARVSEELDYRLEATNQQRFADAFAGHPSSTFPRWSPALSARRVLTTELVAGARYDEVLEPGRQEERDLAGEAIFRFVFGCLYRLRVFNGDPHPGNYLFHGDGRVTFLDFGLVKWFTDADVQLLGRDGPHDGDASATSARSAGPSRRPGSSGPTPP